MNKEHLNISVEIGLADELKAKGYNISKICELAMKTHLERQDVDIRQQLPEKELKECLERVYKNPHVSRGWTKIFKRSTGINVPPSDLIRWAKEKHEPKEEPKA